MTGAMDDDLDRPLSGDEPELGGDDRPVPHLTSGREPVLGGSALRQHLLDLLESGDLEVQQRALFALAVRQDARAVDGLLALLAGEDEFLRGWAARALGQIGDPRAVEPLIVALNDPSLWVRQGVTAALAELKDPRAVGPLIATLGADDRYIYSMAALAAIGEPAVEALIDALSSPNTRVRLGAANALGEIGDIRAVGPLIRLLNDRSGHVRREAAKSLRRIGTPHALAAAEVWQQQSAGRTKPTRIQPPD
ncbi:MAG: hypothetical protein Kow00124_17770 [Anaerolineae bacterium]